MISHALSNEIDFAALARRFDAPGVRGILLTGSHARGDAGPFSDVDLVRLFENGAEPDSAKPDSAKPDEMGPDGTGSHLVDGRLITVSDVDPDGVEAWFTHPLQIIDAVQSVREARILSDPKGICATVKQRACTFRWTEEHQRKADGIAGQTLVGWIEEAHKGLEGLQRNDPGRLLNARFGLSWGLVQVMRVQRGILRNSDNDVLDAIARTLAPDRSWVETAARAFGIKGEPLRAQVIAGLQLYVLTAEPLLPRVTPEIRAMLRATIDTIRHQIRADQQ